MGNPKLEFEWVNHEPFPMNDKKDVMEMVSVNLEQIVHCMQFAKEMLMNRHKVVTVQLVLNSPGDDKWAWEMHVSISVDFDGQNYELRVSELDKVENEVWCFVKIQPFSCLGQAEQNAFDKAILDIFKKHSYEKERS
jgi:hypothetical protein